MAKKVKNAKLIHPKSNINTANKVPDVKSAFSNFSQRLQKSKQKKIQKLSQTRNRIMNKKKQNKVLSMSSRLKKSNKTNKFALLDDNQQGYVPTNKLTHKGKNFEEVKHFNDMHFDNQQNEQYSDDFNEMHGQVNFHGFDDNQNNHQQNPDRRKSKNQIYKQIIQKSKSHKRDRQQQYQQNFNAAVELDQKFPQFVSNLKFRNNDAKVRDKIQNTDIQYERLMNELKEQQRVVANKVIDNNKKGVEKIRKKKNIQLNQLMKNSDNQSEQDIRGWVKGLNSDQENDQESDVEGQEQDQIDQVELSSSQEDEQQDQQDLQEEQQSQEEVQQSNGQNQSSSQQQVVNHKGNEKIIIKNESSNNQGEQNQHEQEDEEEFKKQKANNKNLKNKKINKNQIHSNNKFAANIIKNVNQKNNLAYSQKNKLK